MSASEAVTPSYQVNCTRRISNHHSHVADAVRALTTDNRLRGRYITASALSQVIKKKYDFSNELDFDTATLNKAIGSKFPNIESTGSGYGFHRLVKRIPTEEVEGKRRSTRVVFYCFSATRKEIGQAKAWYKTKISAKRRVDC